MTPKKTVALAADNLVRLGAERLAGLLLELAGEQPAVKRRLRFELAGEAGGEMRGCRDEQADHDATIRPFVR
jgi:hypothetical protein